MMKKFVWFLKLCNGVHFVNCVHYASNTYSFLYVYSPDDRTVVGYH